MFNFKNQTGSLQLIIVFILILGIAAATYLSRYPQIFSPKASESVRVPNAVIKIMPLGDSNTHGVKNGTSDLENVMAGYRYYLYNDLIKLGFVPDFVGSLQSGPSDLIDKDHEGHNGFDTLKIYNLLDNIIPTYSPDIVLLMAGINDFAQPQPDLFRQQVSTRLSAIIDKISVLSPNTKIIVSTITTVGPVQFPGISNLLNTYNFVIIPQVVSQKATEGKNVYLTDMFQALTQSDLSDGVHPNETGYQKMSDVWLNMLQPLINFNNPVGIVGTRSYVPPGTYQFASWFNLPGTQGASWIGLFPKDIPTNQWQGNKEWMYLGNCSRLIGTPVFSPKTGGCPILVPQNTPEGQYEIRVFLLGTTFYQKSNIFTVSSKPFPTVSPPPPQPSPSPSAAKLSVNPSAGTPGSNVIVSWSSIAGINGGSWIGLYSTSEPAGQQPNYKEWMYTGNCSRLVGTPVSSPPTGYCNFTIPSDLSAGAYEFRLFLQGTAFAQSSNQLSITIPAASLSVSTSQVTRGSAINVLWSNIANTQSTSWIGLFDLNTPTDQSGNYKEWMYMGNCSRLIGPPSSSSPSLGSCQFQIPASVNPGVYEIRMFLAGVTYFAKTNNFQIQ